MFSLKSLLDKVTSVQSELNEKLNTSPRSNSPDFLSNPSSQNDVTTGSSLLNQYQLVWEEIHRTSMSQADSAAGAAQSISQLHAWVQRQNYLITQLTMGVSELPVLAQTIDRCTGIVRETGLNISTLLVEMEKLEADCDKLHVERMKSVHRHHLDTYREEKLRELANCKVAMEKSAADARRMRAIQECLALKERHSTFSAEFKQDMDNYKQTGTFSVRDIQTAPLDTLESAFETFVPDEDPELSSFLAAPPSVSSASSHSQPNSMESSQLTSIESDNKLTSLESNDTGEGTSYAPSIQSMQIVEQEESEDSDLQKTGGSDTSIDVEGEMVPEKLPIAATHYEKVTEQPMSLLPHTSDDKTELEGETVADTLVSVATPGESDKIETDPT